MAAVMGLEQCDHTGEIAAERSSLRLVQRHAAVAQVIGKARPWDSVDAWHQNSTVQPMGQLAAVMGPRRSLQVRRRENATSSTCLKCIVAWDKGGNCLEIISIETSTGKELLDEPSPTRQLSDRVVRSLAPHNRKDFRGCDGVLDRLE